ncbi:hypothetical protein [Collimonas humicola]|uniref:hypothetical protein n=1 Tax=Collimonas humicola TaxID=2825886 RepID=UPI001B8C72B0|nr:hypothetical protein [Collimonas humicola]
MNAKQLFSIVALLSASGIAMAQAPVAEKPAGAVVQNASAETKNRTDKKQAQADGKPAKPSAHDHKEDGPKKTIHSGA